MIFKERIVHFIEENSERFKLSYQSTLHSIQMVNVLEGTHPTQINAFIGNSWLKAKCLALNALQLSAKFYEGFAMRRREVVKAIDEKYKGFEI